MPLQKPTINSKQLHSQLFLYNFAAHLNHDNEKTTINNTTRSSTTLDSPTAVTIAGRGTLDGDDEKPVNRSQ